MQDASPLLSEIVGPVALLTLNRPERLNAVSLEMYERMTAVLRDVAGRESVRAIVVTGAGRAFCVGADLKAHGSTEPTLAERRRYVWAGQRVNRRIQALGKPVVAAVNGHAIGAGLELALSTDFVVVAADAKLRFPEVSLGTFVGGGVTYTLAERVGVLKAKELVLLGEYFTGRDAVTMGVANRAVPAERVREEALEVAHRLAAKAPIAMAYAKRLLNRARSSDAKRALAAEARALLACMGTEDWREGIRAHHEKRDPVYHGR